MTPAPDITDLIAEVETDADSPEPLDRLAAAAAMAADLGGLADRLVGHYVDEARRAGASWADIGAEIGVTKQAAHQGHRARGARPRRRDDVFEGRMRLATDHFKLAIQESHSAAARFGADRVDAEHLLLGVLAVPESAGAVALTNLGVTVANVESRLVMPASERSASSAVHWFAPPAKKVLHHAHRIARRERCRFLGTEHIVMSLTHGDGLATTILHDLGATPERVDAEVHTSWGRRP
jgi:hypothetical protein